MDIISISSFFDITTYKHRDLFGGCNSVWEVLPRIKKYLEGEKLGVVDAVIERGSYIVNPESVSIGRGTIVEPGAYIKGPCIIGRGCTIRHSAYIRGNVIVGDSCVIGHSTEIKNSVMLNGANAAHFAYVGDSILGNRVNLGAGVKCANLKLDGSTVVVSIDGKHINTGLRKFGVILGDDVQLGCNSVTNPGTMMGKRSMSYPCATISGLICSDEIVR